MSKKISELPLKIGTSGISTGEIPISIGGTTFKILPSQLTTSDLFVSGMTFNQGTYDLTIKRNDNVSFTQNLGILSSDMTVTGGTYDINTGIVTFTNNSGGTFNVTGFTSGMTDTFTTGGTYSNGTINFGKNIGTNYSVTGLFTGNNININGDIKNTSGSTEWRVAQADTGVLTYGGAVASGTTKINIGAATGYVVNNETNPLQPTYTYVNYSGQTGLTVTTLSGGIATYVMLDSNGIITFQNTFPTSSERKAKIWLSKIGHPTGLISTVGNEVDFITSPLSQFRDLFQAINYINDGVYPYASSANLTFGITSGNIHGDGINFTVDRTKPNEVNMGGTNPTTFSPRTQTGGTATGTTLIDPTIYDNAGVLTTVPNNANSTIQYIYCVPALGFVIQYGQTVYSNLNNAIAAVGKETFTIYPNLIQNAILIGVLCVTKNCTNLTDDTRAMFFRASKFGENIGSTAGISTGTLQSTYNNSTPDPEIQLDSTRGAFTLKGYGIGTNKNFESENSGGTVTFAINADGGVTANGNIVGANIQATSGITAGGINFLNSIFVSQTLPNDMEQGYTWDGTNHYLFGTNKISKRDSSFSAITENTNPLSGITGVNHLGDGVYLGGFLYAPVESYPAVTGMKIAKYDATTLTLVTTYDISAQGHECSSITTDGSILYISSYLDGTKLWKYSLTGTFLGIITFTTPFTNNIQGVSYYNGDFYIVEQTRLSKVSFDGLVSTYIGDIPGSINTHRGEGLDVISGVARTVVNNEANNGINIYYFDLTTTASSPKFGVDNYGRVAIGLSATTLQTEIVGNNDSNEQILLVQNTNTTTATGIVAKDNVGTKFFTMGVINSASVLNTTYGNPGEGFIRSSAAAPGMHISAAGGYIRFGNAGTERFRMDSGGRLLVGMSAAVTTNYFQVNGDSTINGLNIGRGGGNLSQNTVLGFSALFNNTTGNLNTAIGYQTLVNNTIGNNNTAVGYQSMLINTSGGTNTAIGYQTLLNNTRGNNNSVLGHGVMANNTTGGDNTAIGYQALSANITGSEHVALGFWSLKNIVGNSANVSIGTYAGSFLADGSTALTGASTSVFLGYFAKANGNGQSNQIVIGWNAIGNGSNSVTLGNTAVTKTILQGNISIGTSANTTTAKVQIDSTTQGFLPPRMTSTQRLAISSPAIGLMVYQTDGTEGVYVNSSTGWKNLTWI